LQAKQLSAVPTASASQARQRSTVPLKAPVNIRLEEDS
jgi:hypothetical protein